MSAVMNKDHEKIITHYIHAKDENRPHLMKNVFTNSATLEIVLKTESISFPSCTVGLHAISDVLVSKFNITYENIYTYCFIDSLKQHKNELSCSWLVTMSEKANGSVRVGYGQYNWHFDNEGVTLADRLIITIEKMVTLNSSFSDQIMDWLNTQPYPWCNSVSISQTMPEIEALDSIRTQMS